MPRLHSRSSVPPHILLGSQKSVVRACFRPKVLLCRLSLPLSQGGNSETMLYFFHSIRRHVQSRLLATWFALIVVPKFASSAALECNGLSNLCSVKVTDAYFAMVHNGMAAAENGFVLAPNHMENPIPDAFDSGYRGMNVDICNCNGQLELCHGSDVLGCGVGRVDPVAAFTAINNWIIANPNNVIIITLEINSGADEEVTLDMVHELLQQIPDGFINRFYDRWPVSNTTTDWPTLGDLIANEQQVLFFYFDGPAGTGDHITGLNYWYDFALATDFQWDSLQEIESTMMSSCPITRGLTSTGDFFLLEATVQNEFFGMNVIPSQEAAQTINTVEWTGPVLDACAAIHGFPPTIVAVDFWTEGNLTTLIQERNALIVGAPTPLVTLSPTSLVVPSPAPSLLRSVTEAPTPPTSDADTASEPSTPVPTPLVTPIPVDARGSFNSVEAQSSAAIIQYGIALGASVIAMAFV